MKIQVGGLSEGIHTYHFQLPAAELNLGEGIVDGLVVDATLDKTGNQLRLKTTIQAQGSFACDRCLAQFSSPLASSYQMTYVTEGNDYSGVDPSEVQVVPPGFTVIDLSEDVRQTVLLSVPLKLLCSETCRGLCPRCGKNLNKESCSCKETAADSRWDKLRTLQKNNMQNQN